jgi:3-phenylpropionate/trans-cinnamate dioxygenase ferredoxin reductase subunit
MKNDAIVIVGAGQAAGQLAASLAQEGLGGRVTLVGDEPHLPYQRPPLSKKFLAGEIELDRLFVKPPAFYDKHGIGLRLDRRAVRIDRAERVVVLEDGTSLPYGTLVLATGSRPRRLPLPGAELEGIFYLRGIADVAAIRARFAPGRSLVVVGGGYIGLELAAVAVRLGLEVTVLEQASRLMARGVGPIVSQFYEHLHRAEGISLHLGATVVGFEGKRSVRRVVCNGGFDADIVVIGAGALPNVELAQDAGLATADGIVVDAQCRTADPAVYAIGDCTSQFHPLVERNLRLESVHNALEQARIAAASICGKPLPAVQVPWFWSDQYDVKLQMAGIPASYDNAIVRGQANKRSFAVFYLANDTLVGIDAVNRPADFMVSKLLIGERARVDRAKLHDEGIAVKDSRL